MSRGVDKNVCLALGTSTSFRTVIGFSALGRFEDQPSPPALAHHLLPPSLISSASTHATQPARPPLDFHLPALARDVLRVVVGRPAERPPHRS